MLTTSALSVESLISEEKQGIIKYFVMDDNNYLTFFRYLTLMYCIDVTRRWAGGICLTLRSWFAEAVVMCPRYSEIMLTALQSLKMKKAIPIFFVPPPRTFFYFLPQIRDLYCSA